MEDDDLPKDSNPNEKLNTGKGNSQNEKGVVWKFFESFENFQKFRKICLGFIWMQDNIPECKYIPVGIFSFSRCNSLEFS